MRQCQAIAESGQQCPRPADEGQTYCWLHRIACHSADQTATAAEENSTAKSAEVIVGQITQSHTPNPTSESLLNKTDSPSLPPGKDIAPGLSPDEAIVKELAKYSVKLMSDLKDGPPYRVMIPFLPLAGTRGEANATNVVGYANDLSVLLRQMQGVRARTRQNDP